MKKFLYSLIFILIIMVLADRALKIYEKKQAASDIKKRCASLPSLSAGQVKDYAEATQFHLEPYLMFGLKPNFKSGAVNINSLGLRGGEIREKEKGCYRIVVLGGSAVFGGEVSNDNLAFPALVAGNLNKDSGVKAEVINAGVPAYISMQELILLEDRIIGLNPDLLVVFDGFNDILTILKRETRPNYPWWFSEIEKAYYTSVTKLFFEKKIMKYRPARFIINWLEKKKPLKADYKENPEQIIFYRRNLGLMCRLAKSSGAEAMLIFQPTAVRKQYLTEKEKDALGCLEAAYLETLRKMCGRGVEAVREAAEDNDVPWADGSRFFDGIKEDIFIDEVHFNQAGHEIVARSLAEMILTAGFVKVKRE